MKSSARTSAQGKASKPTPVKATVPDKLTLVASKPTARRLRRTAEILAAAREVFLKKGFENASVGEIAARVGVVEGLVYSYFPTKRDLLNEVLREMYEPLIQDVAEGFSRIQGLGRRRRFLVWRHLRVYVEEPSMSRIVLHEVRTSPEYFKSVLHDLQVRYTAFLMRTVREAIEAGELPADTDVETVRSVVYGGIEHRMWSLLYGRGSIDVEAMADRYTATLLHGMLASQGPHGASQQAAPAHGDIERRLLRLERIVATQLPSAKPAPAAKAAPRRGKLTA
jgi:AcrR family transcriptional regulator